MRSKLMDLLAEVQGGNENVYLLTAKTLREFLLELQGMCQPAGVFVQDQTPVIVKENKGREGFSLSVPIGDGGEVDAPYEMEWDLTDPGIKLDSWDRDAPPPGTKGVIWQGPRLVIHRVTNYVNTIDDNGDETAWAAYNAFTLNSRTITYDSKGAVQAISIEQPVNSDFGSIVIPSFQ